MTAALAGLPTPSRECLRLSQFCEVSAFGFQKMRHILRNDSSLLLLLLLLMPFPAGASLA